MNTDENTYLSLLAKVLNKTATAKEQQDLEQWAASDPTNQVLVEEVQQAWDLSEDYLEDVPVDTVKAWERFKSSIAVETPSSIRALESSSVGTVRSIFSYWKAAAVVVLVSSLLLTWWMQQEVHQPNQILPELALVEAKDAQQTVTLPDGSTVLLNAGASISYDKKFEVRQVNLEGEAFFEVTKQDGASFEVLTGTTTTRVLGTSFTVRNHPNEGAVEVSVLTGRVEVADKAVAEKIVLQPAEKAIVQKATASIVKTAEENPNAFAWKTGQLDFENTSMEAVIETLERYFQIQIESENPALLKCYYTGSFSKPSIDEVLNTMAFTFPSTLEVKTVDEKYILIGEGCE